MIRGKALINHLRCKRKEGGRPKIKEMGSKSQGNKVKRLHCEQVKVHKELPSAPQNARLNRIVPWTANNTYTAMRKKKN